MLLLKYPALTPATQALEERLAQLSLAFKTEHDPTLETPVLIEGNTTIAGIEYIAKHLDQLAGELHSWWYCNC